MRYYEHNTEGFLVGWYNADSPRANSTDVAPTGIPPDCAKWNGTAWTNDATQQGTRDAAKVAKDAVKDADKQRLKDIDPDTATDADVLLAMRAFLRSQQE
jgi:hypothetical protein